MYYVYVSTFCQVANKVCKIPGTWAIYRDVIEFLYNCKIKKHHLPGVERLNNPLFIAHCSSITWFDQPREAICDFVWLHSVCVNRQSTHLSYPFTSVWGTLNRQDADNSWHYALEIHPRPRIEMMSKIKSIGVLNKTFSRLNKASLSRYWGDTE